MTSRDAVRRCGCALASLLAIWLLSGLADQRAGILLPSIVGGLLVLAAFRPFESLLVFAGLGPLATMLAALLGAPFVRLSDAMALAFIGGACARGAVLGTRVAPSRLAWPSVALGAAALASAAISASVQALEAPELTGGGHFPIVLLREYLTRQGDVSLAVQLVEGLLLLGLSSTICAERDGRGARAIGMIVVGATAGATLNVLRVVTAALQHAAFWSALGPLATGLRVNVLFADWNAAGSYFAMALVFAVALTAARRTWAIAVVLLSAGLWLTGSRSALAAATVVGVLAAIVIIVRRDRIRSGPAAVALVVLIAAAAAGWRLYPERRNDPVAFSLSTRAALSAAGLHMAVDHPVFGVGIGNYYELSSVYAADVLTSFGRQHENAHDYFVQVLAELGVPGVALFLTILLLPLKAAWPGRGDPPMTWGLFGGLLVFLLTCLSGHPFMTAEATYPFWLALGVAGAPLSGASPRRARVVCGLLVLLYVVSLPWRIEAARRNAHLENTAIGLSAWLIDGTDQRFRYGGVDSTFYFPARAGGVIIPLKHGPDGPDPIQARIFIDGRESDGVRLEAAQPWRRIRFVAGQRARGDYSRVDVRVTDPSGAPLDPAARRRYVQVGLPTLIWDIGTDPTPGGDTPLLADLDGDGKADLLLWSPTTGVWRWLLSSRAYDDAMVRSVRWPQQGLGGVPLAADLDGDGVADFVIWRPSTGTFQWLLSSGSYRVSGAATVSWSDHQPGDVPLVADLDGDGKADLVLWRPAAGTWFWRPSSVGYREVRQTPAPNAEALANRAPEDIVMFADVDHDRKPHAIFWSPATGTWHWRPAAGTAGATGSVHWGTGSLGDVPVAADIDGDGRADLVVWRASTRTWYWLTSSSRYAASAAGVKPWKF